MRGGIQWSWGGSIQEPGERRKLKRDCLVKVEIGAQWARTELCKATWEGGILTVPQMMHKSGSDQETEAI